MVRTQGQIFYRWKRGRHLRRIRRRMAASWGNSGRRRLLFAGRGSRGDSCGLFAFYGFGRGRENRGLPAKSSGLSAWGGCGLAVLERVEETGAGASPGGNSVEEGIQIRLDEMRILFFRIRREEERGRGKEDRQDGRRVNMPGSSVIKGTQSYSLAILIIPFLVFKRILYYNLH